MVKDTYSTSLTNFKIVIVIQRHEVFEMFKLFQCEVGNPLNETIEKPFAYQFWSYAHYRTYFEYVSNQTGRYSTFMRLEMKCSMFISLRGIEF